MNIVFEAGLTLLLYILKVVPFHNLHKIYSLDPIMLLTDHTTDRSRYGPITLETDHALVRSWSNHIMVHHGMVRKSIYFYRGPIMLWT